MKTFLPHLYEAVANEAMFGIVVFDPRGHCLFSNKMAIQLLGAERPRLEDLIPGESYPQIKSFSREFLKHDGLYQDIMIKNAEGGKFIANIGVRYLVVDHHMAHLLMFQDVTLQKKLQREIHAKQAEIKATFEELLRQNQQLRELDLAKDRFIALTTHELRTPLSAMVAAAEILKMGIYDGPEQMNEFIEIIYDQGLHLQDLVNDILDFAKIQAGKMDFYLEEQNVTPLAQAVMRHFEGMAGTSGVTLELQLPEEPIRCYFDDVRLRQVLSNIINNAIKYNRAGGQATLIVSDHPNHARVAVRDTGPGIPRDQFEKIFDEFEMAGQVARHHKGTGLGLPISLRLMQGMGGKLLLDSEVGVGSTFWVEIPKTKVLAEELYRKRPGQSGDLAA